MRWFALLFGFALALSGCVIRNHCTPNNCDGCCDATGMCQAGTSAASCGQRGAACTTCSGVGASCSLGVCSGATAGGTAGGVGGGSSGGGVSGPTFSVLFLWSFAGQTCAEAAVSNVTVTIAGTPVTNQSFRCNASGTDGVLVQGVPVGTFTATLEGRDATNAVRFRGTAPVRITTQDISATVALERVMATGPGELLVRWSFPPLSVSNTPTCAQATIARVSVAVNGGTASAVACSTGEAAGMGFRVRNVMGTAQLDLSAADSNGFVYFRKREPVQVTAGASTPVTVALDWDVGSLPVRWEFRENNAVRTCAQVGATSVYLNLRDAQGQLLYPGAGAEVACTDAMTGQATVFPYLPDGTYAVFFQAVGTGGTLYKTNQTSPPSVTVRRGQFPTLSSTTTTYTLAP